MGKKSKQSEKNKTKDLEEVADCTDAEPKGLITNSTLREENKERKKKKKQEVAADIGLDSTQHDEIKNENASVDVNSDLPKESNIKKKKRKLEFSEEVTNSEAAAVIGVEVDNGQKDQKKKKNRKLESGESIDDLDNKVLTEEENGGLQTDDRTVEGKGNGLKTRKDKKKQHEKEREKGVTDTVIPSQEIEKEDITKIKHGEDGAKKKKNKAGSDIENKGVKAKKKTKDGKFTKDCDGDVFEEVEKKKRKKEKKKDKGDLGDGLEGNLTKELDNETTSIGDKEFVDFENGKNGKRKKNKSVEKDSESLKAKGKSKKVSFSGHVEVFPPNNKLTKGGNTSEDGLLRAKRFTPEEDEIIKEAIHNYVKVHGLGEKGLNMVLHCGSYPEVRNCWKEIGAAIPYRPSDAINYRAHVLFERSENRTWTEEEYELIKKHHEKNGNNWKKLADELGKHRIHVKDTWRRIKLPNERKGHWDQDEYQKLFDLVNKDLQMKAYEEKKSKHGMLRDNICWSAISDKLSTRATANCCMKWYGQLTSPMVADGKWADVDDYRLLDGLYKLDACCVEDVNWDSLIEHRPGDVCRKRWDQMVLHIGQHGTKSFSEQVDILAKRYCPDLIEAREAWDNKPVVP